MTVTFRETNSTSKSLSSTINLNRTSIVRAALSYYIMLGHLYDFFISLRKSSKCVRACVIKTNDV